MKYFAAIGQVEGLLGHTEEEKTEVIQWLEFLREYIQPQANMITYSILGYLTPSP